MIISVDQTLSNKLYKISLIRCQGNVRRLSYPALQVNPAGVVRLADR